MPNRTGKLVDMPSRGDALTTKCYTHDMKILTIDEIEKLHKKHAPTQDVFNEIWEHCKIVRDIALNLQNKQGLKLNTDLVTAGALLHDIGVYRLYNANNILDEANYIQHGSKGYELLKEEEASEELARFASHHTGVGLTADEIRKNNLPLPHVDFLADTGEERLVMYADKFHSKLPSQFNTLKWYKEHVGRFGEEKVQTFEAMACNFGEPDVQSLAIKYGQNYR